MATAYHNLSDYDFTSVPDASQMRLELLFQNGTAI